MKINLVLDVNDAGAQTAFWTKALGYEVFFSEGAYVGLRALDGSGAPKLYLQRVAEGKAAKNRMHIDWLADDAEAEAERLLALGASRVGSHHENGVSWITMKDPEGNEFCVEQSSPVNTPV